MRDTLLSLPEALKDIIALDKGVHLFGHNHIQFHMEYEGRLFINPGSCGDSCDFNTSASYDLLEYDEAASAHSKFLGANTDTFECGNTCGTPDAFKTRDTCGAPDAYGCLFVFGNWKLTERRVKYDIEAVVDMLRRSELAAISPEWSRCIELELTNGKDYIGSFVKHIRKVAGTRGETNMPVSNALFREAANTWDPELII
jgi:hypothetical protein